MIPMPHSRASLSIFPGRRVLEPPREFTAGSIERSIFVETEQGRLNVDAPAFGGYAVGDTVTVTVPQSAAWAVVDQGDAVG